MSVPEDQIAQIIAALRTSLGNAFANVYVNGAGSDSSTDATLGSLNRDGLKIDDLEGRMANDVRSGSLDYSRWFGVAQGVSADIAFNSGLSDSWSFTQFVQQTFTDSNNVLTGQGSIVQKTGDAVKEAVDRVLPTLDFAFVALAALAVAYVVYVVHKAA